MTDFSFEILYFKQPLTLSPPVLFYSYCYVFSQNSGNMIKFNFLGILFYMQRFPLRVVRGQMPVTTSERISENSVQVVLLTSVKKS